MKHTTHQERVRRLQGSDRQAGRASTLALAWCFLLLLVLLVLVLLLLLCCCCDVAVAVAAAATTLLLLVTIFFPRQILVAIPGTHHR